MLPRGSDNLAPFHTFEQCRARDNATPKYLIYGGLIGGPDRDRTDDLFHAMEARSQLRHRPTFRWDNSLIFAAPARFVKSTQAAPINCTSSCLVPAFDGLG